MNKWVTIPVISILAIAVIGVGVFLWLQTSKLGDAESEIVSQESEIASLEEEVTSLQGNVTNLEANVTSLEDNVSTLETSLSDSEEMASTLETDLETANSKISNLQGDVSIQRNINSQLTNELKTVKDPRHFSSLTELTDWLNKDETESNTDKTGAQLAFMIQVSALRDGYILSTLIFDNGSASLLAVIEDEYWGIDPETDESFFFDYIKPLPSHPLPLD